jgi:hypothetical protein
MGFERQFGAHPADGKPRENWIEIVGYAAERCKGAGVRLRMRRSSLSRHTSAWACFRTAKLRE